MKRRAGAIKGQHSPQMVKDGKSQRCGVILHNWVEVKGVTDECCN